MSHERACGVENAGVCVEFERIIKVSGQKRVFDISSFILVQVVCLHLQDSCGYGQVLSNACIIAFLSEHRRVVVNVENFHVDVGCRRTTFRRRTLIGCHNSENNLRLLLSVDYCGVAHEHLASIPINLELLTVLAKQ